MIRRLLLPCLALTTILAARGREYVPHLPKTAPATSIVIVDLAKDKSTHDWRAVEALIASQVIQGIVNRDSPEKIYFVNNKRRWNGEWNPWPMDEFALKDGMIPVPHTRAVLDEQKKFPALSYLLRHYAKTLKGRIRMQALGQTDERFAGPDGGVMAALTAAGQLDAVVVSPALERYLAAEGVELPLLEDTTHLSERVAAFDWAYRKFFRPTTTRQFVGKLSLNNFGNFPPRFAPTTIDYFIASRAFILDLNANFPVESAAMPRLLNEGNYAPGTPVLGDIDWEVTELDRISELGYFFNFAVDGPNYSVTSSFPSRPERISTPAFPQAAPVEPNGVYLAFYVTDGDNLSFSYYVHRSAWRTSPTAGQVPIGWSYNPLLFDLFPTQLAWLSKNNYDHAFELVSNFNNGRPDLPSSAPATAGFTHFAALLRSYIEHTNGVFSSINNLGDSDTAARLYQEVAAPQFAFSGYAGKNQQEAPDWHVLPHGTPTTKMIGATQREATAPAITEQIARIVANSPVGKPLFLLVAAGDSGHSGDSVQLVTEIKTILAARADGRAYRYVRPVDLAATWKASQGLATSAVLEAGADGTPAAFPATAGTVLEFRLPLDGDRIALRYANASRRPMQCGLYVDGKRVRTVQLPPTPDAATYARAEVTGLGLKNGAMLALRCDTEDAAANAPTAKAWLDQVLVSASPDL